MADSSSRNVVEADSPVVAPFPSSITEPQAQRLSPPPKTPSSQPRSPTSSQSQSEPAPASPLASSRRRSSTVSSFAQSASGRLRSASVKILEADPPVGMWAATGQAASKAPGLQSIRRGSYHHEAGWNADQQQLDYEKRNGTTRTTDLGLERRVTPSVPTVKEEGIVAEENTKSETRETSTQEKTIFHRHGWHRHGTGVPVYTNGYVPPPKLPWTTSTIIGLKGFWKWFCTPAGFLITIYGLNVVAWGGMLFLLLLNAAPAMCHPTCDDLQSPRRIWIEIDSQILNALFCVTGFGLIPWRFRDFYYLLMWRYGIRGKSHEQRFKGLRTLAGIHRDWFRLEGSDKLPVETAPTVGSEDALPLPVEKAPDPPATGVRAPPTAGWKLDFVIWLFVWNTILQAILSGFMWGYNRYDRPSWSTGLFVALGCIVAGVAGIMMFIEGKAVKKVEGVPSNVPDDYEGTRPV